MLLAAHQVNNLLSKVLTRSASPYAQVHTLSKVSGPVYVPAECHQSESGCTGLSALWRCGPSGSGRSLHTEREQTHTHKGTTYIYLSQETHSIHFSSAQIIKNVYSFKCWSAESQIYKKYLLANKNFKVAISLVVSLSVCWSVHPVCTQFACTICLYTICVYRLTQMAPTSMRELSVTT